MKYPLCERAGLEIQEHRVIVGFSRGEAYELNDADFIRAADVEKWLEGATVVRARLYDNEVFGEWYDKAQEDDTHTARLVMIEPIVKESEERRLLRELVNTDISTPEGLARHHKAFQESRRLLEGK